MNTQKVSTKEKISYIAVNLGNIPITTLISTYLLIFYTNVVGLSPAACATLFLIARILDGLNDPIVGYFIDHLPNTRLGHFRPPLIIGTVLCCLNYLLLWFGPMMAMTGKLAIAYISYLLIGILFPVMDISLNSMLPVMTTDMEERNSLSAMKGIFYMLGALVLSIAAPLVIGEASNRDGYIKLILVVTALVFVLSVVGTMGLKERVKPLANNNKYNIRDFFGIILKKPVWSTFLGALFYSVAFTLTGTVNTYYYTYVIGDLKISSVIALVTTVAIFPPMILLGKLIHKFGKKNLYIAGLIIFGIFPLIRLFDISSIPMLIICSLMMGIGQGLCMSLMYGIQADNTDYIELETGKRAEGAISSLSSFITKFAMGVGGAIPGYALAFAHFDSSAAQQPTEVIGIIMLCLSVLPAILTALAAIIFKCFYPLNKERLQMQNDLLDQRRSWEVKN